MSEEYNISVNDSYAGDDDLSADDSDCEDNPRLTICLDEDVATKASSPGASDQEVPATPKSDTQVPVQFPGRKEATGSGDDICQNFQSQNQYVQQEMDKILQYVAHGPGQSYPPTVSPVTGVSSEGSRDGFDEGKMYGHHPDAMFAGQGVGAPMPVQPMQASNKSSGQRARRNFNGSQVEALQHAFQVNPYPSRKDMDALSARIGISHKNCKLWFQNHRAKLKREGRLETTLRSFIPNTMAKGEPLDPKWTYGAPVSDHSQAFPAGPPVATVDPNTGVPTLPSSFSIDHIAKPLHNKKSDVPAAVTTYRRNSNGSSKENTTPEKNTTSGAGLPDPQCTPIPSSRPTEVENSPYTSGTPTTSTPVLPKNFSLGSSKEKQQKRQYQQMSSKPIQPDHPYYNLSNYAPIEITPAGEKHKQVKRKSTESTLGSTPTAHYRQTVPTMPQDSEPVEPAKKMSRKSSQSNMNSSPSTMSSASALQQQQAMAAAMMNPMMNPMMMMNPYASMGASAGSFPYMYPGFMGMQPPTATPSSKEDVPLDLTKSSSQPLNLKVKQEPKDNKENNDVNPLASSMPFAMPGMGGYPMPFTSMMPPQAAAMGMYGMGMFGYGGYGAMGGMGTMGMMPGMMPPQSQQSQQKK